MDALEAILADATPEERAGLIRLGREECWRNGNLRHLLHPGNQEIYDELLAHPEWSRVVLELARKYGKTFLILVVFAELALRNPGCRLVYGAPTYKHLEEFAMPVMAEVEKDAPADCRPEYEEKRGHWTFPNGAWVHLFGADDKRKANRGRGPKAIATAFDEAGFTDVLAYVISSIFRPSLLLSADINWLGGGKRKRGLTLLGSTPSDEPDHDFTKIAEQAESNDTYFRRTVYQNPLLTTEQIEAFIAEDAHDNGQTVEEYQKSDVFQREYLALRVVDKTLVVMGEDWTLQRERSLVAVPRPEFFDGYEALDMGGVDPTAVLFGYWHFVPGWLVIEDEVLLRDGENTEQLAERVQAKERELWGATGWDGTLRAIHEEKDDPTFLAALPPWARAKVEASAKAPLQPYLRVCDHDFEIANELAQLHGITYLPTEKTEKHWHINELRILVRQGRLKVHPRCRGLDRHLKQTVWSNHRRSDYKRKSGEHGDLVDCLSYMARNIRKNRNPVPLNYGLDPEHQLVIARPAVNPLKLLVGLPKRR